MHLQVVHLSLPLQVYIMEIRNKVKYPSDWTSSGFGLAGLPFAMSLRCMKTPWMHPTHYIVWMPLISTCTPHGAKAVTAMMLFFVVSNTACVCMHNQLVGQNGFFWLAPSDLAIDKGGKIWASWQPSLETFLASSPTLSEKCGEPVLGGTWG